jgi:hypothetical protein
MRAYSHQGHGPRADQKGRIHPSDFRFLCWLGRASSAQTGASNRAIMRYEHTDFEWAGIRSFLPNKRVLNGIFLVPRSGAPWRDLPVYYGPRTKL